MIFLPFFLATTSMAGVIPYNFPDAMPRSPVHSATVDGAAIPALKTERGSILSFGMEGPLEIAITVAGAPKEVVVRPLSAGIKARID